MKFHWIDQLETLNSSQKENSPNVLSKIREFDPDVILVSGWSQPVYRVVCKKLKQDGIYVISGMDNPWIGSFRQWFRSIFCETIFTKQL